MNQRDETEWISCKLQKEKLVTGLAEIAWQSETKNVDSSKLYNPDGTVVDEWASHFFMIRMAYEQMLDSYIQIDAYDNNEEGRTESEGVV